MEFNEKTVGYILYAIGIVGGVEGATDARPGSSLVISIHGRYHHRQLSIS